MALGSAIHKRSSCTQTPTISARLIIRVTSVRLIKGKTHTKRTVPTNDIPKVLEELPCYSSGFFGLNIPLVSLKVFTLSATGPWKG